MDCHDLNTSKDCFVDANQNQKLIETDQYNTNNHHRPPTEQNMKNQITTVRLVLNRFAFQELLLIFFFVLLINNYFQNDDVRIRADGKGYYDYLPALFIYHDLNFQCIDTLVTELYIHRESSNGYLPEINGVCPITFR